MFDKIVKLCEENNISVLVLEEKLGFGKCTISKWKKSSPTVNKLKKKWRIILGYQLIIF
jgi:transcriptional regulator with XRE-family HTH domain